MSMDKPSGNGAFTWFYRLNHRLEQALEFIGTSLLGIFIVLVIYQIISRNIDFIPVILWTEEVSRFSFMWMIMMGATIGLLHSDHFLIDIFENNAKARRVAAVVREILILITLLVFLTYGWQFGMTGTRRISMAAKLPMVYVYMSFFVMGLFGAIFTLQRMLMMAQTGVDEVQSELDQDDAFAFDSDADMEFDADQLEDGRE
ncbi:MAG: TRAP transporter small permease subunit [Spirochaetes bacterium]|jgi:TRAP-type C4-dicarboxylate transport system permease small subunit|nr:TRAP transporter small permease subunit [Spirochaetota bacterium]